MADPKTPSEDDITDATASEIDEAQDEAVEEAEIVENTADVEDDRSEPVVEEIVEESVEAIVPPVQHVTQVRKGPGVFSLLVGGVLAAAIGYGAAYFGVLSQSNDTGLADAVAALEAELATQSTGNDALADQIAALETAVSAIPAPPDPVDLTPLSDQIGALSNEIGGTGAALSGLADRVAYLETLPLGDENAGDNSVAIAAAVAQLQSQLTEDATALAAQQAEANGLAETLRSVAAEAEAAIAAAQADAEARMSAATAQAALGQLRIAVATGAPFTSALQDVADSADIGVPEALETAAGNGVPRLETLQAAFPTAARAALPIAIRETAGEGTMDRMTAFLQSQVGGRSLDPREGDDPDAILSRAQAALQSGDIGGALSEIAALPQDAQDAMSTWIADAAARRDATQALDAFAAALDALN